MRMDFVMVEKDPTSYSLITYIWVIGLSAWGGVAGYIRRVKTKNQAHFSLAELVGEICISGFVGVLTFYFCESANLNPILAAALVGVSGHMGSRSLYFLEAICKRKISQIVGANVEDL
jgi:hypothetical protein